MPSITDATAVSSSSSTAIAGPRILGLVPRPITTSTHPAKKPTNGLAELGKDQASHVAFMRADQAKEAMEAMLEDDDEVGGNSSTESDSSSDATFKVYTKLASAGRRCSPRKPPVPRNADSERVR